jgi:hypothetical protein
LFKFIGNKERVQHCLILIYHTEGCVIKNSQKLTEQIKKKSFELIKATEREMEELNGLKRTT